MNPYSCSSNLIFSLRPSKETKQYSVFTVETRSIWANAEANPAVSFGDYYKPSGAGRFPLLILAHGIGDKGDSLWLKTWSKKELPAS
jgi:hypothetical protein